MKRLIYQVSVGDPPPFYKTCTDSVYEYCGRYGIDHIIQTVPVIKLRPVNSHRSEMAVERFGYLPHFEKANAFLFLDEYDQIAIIDADIFIRDNAPNLFDEMNDNTVVAGVRECDMPLTPQTAGKVKEYSYGQYGMLPEMKKLDGPNGIPFYNTGVLVFNSQKFKPYLNGNTPEEFVKRKEFEKFVNGEGKWKWASDQTPLNWWFQKEGMVTQNLDWKWNALYKGIHDNKLAEAYTLHFFLATKLQKQGVDIVKVIEKLK